MSISTRTGNAPMDSLATDTIVQPPGPWIADALCRDIPDPDIFYPAHQDHTRAARARQLCGACPVREQCLTYALGNNERYGIWGGLDPTERDALRRRLRDNARRARRLSAA